MKKILLTSLVALGVAGTANAGVYVAGYLSTYNDSKAVVAGFDMDNEVSFFDNLNLDFTVGYAFGNGIRVEADVMSVALYEKDYDFADTFGISIGVNAVKGLYDFGTWSNFTPYVGAGLTDLDYMSFNDEFAFNVVGVVGVSYAITENVSVDLQYNRTFGYNSNGEGIDASYNGVNVIKLGGMYKF